MADVEKDDVHLRLMHGGPFRKLMVLVGLRRLRRRAFVFAWLCWGLLCWAMLGGDGEIHYFPFFDEFQALSTTIVPALKYFAFVLRDNPVRRLISRIDCFSCSAIRRMMFKSPMWITPLPPVARRVVGKVHMAQFSMEIMRRLSSVRKPTRAATNTEMVAVDRGGRRPAVNLESRVAVAGEDAHPLVVCNKTIQACNEANGALGIRCGQSGVLRLRHAGWLRTGDLGVGRDLTIVSPQARGWR